MLESLFAIQKPVMLFFQSITNPVLTTLATGVTLFGEAGLAIVILFVLLWGIDKKRGFKVGLTLILSLVLMNVLKLIFRIPRPFMVYPELECLRLSTATGYSFPSGHSTCAAALLGALLLDTRKKWLKTLMGILIVLVPVSRIYLQCHWPLDTVVGALIGVSFALCCSSLVSKLYDDKDRLKSFTLTAFAISAVAGLLLAILIQFGILDAMWKDMMETFGMMAGIAIGLYHEKTTVSYRIPEDTRKRIIAVLVGTVPGLLVYLVLDKVPFLENIFKLLAYTFIAAWAVYIYPLIAEKKGLLEKEA